MYFVPIFFAYQGLPYIQTLRRLQTYTLPDSGESPSNRINHLVRCQNSKPHPMKDDFSSIIMCALFLNWVLWQLQAGVHLVS